MINQPLKAEISQLLTRLEAVWEDFPNEELGDTLSREILFGALKAGFLDPQPDYQLTRQFSMDDPAANSAIYTALSEFLPAARAAADKAGLTTPQQRIAAFFADIQGENGAEVDDFFGWMEPEDWLLNFLGALVGSYEKDPVKLSKLLLNATAKEYSSQRKEKFANIKFIYSIVELSRLVQSELLARNCILIMGHICGMYSFYPVEAFQFLWSYADDKKLIRFASREISGFPQFLKQKDFKSFLLKLASAYPRKDAIILLYINMFKIKDNIDDTEFLNNVIKVFENYIGKHPDEYECQNSYAKLVAELRQKVSRL